MASIAWGLRCSDSVDPDKSTTASAPHGVELLASTHSESDGRGAWLVRRATYSSDELNRIGFRL